MSSMNADFDGDQLNIFRIMGEDLNKAFSKNLSPNNMLYINHIDGRVNPQMMPSKDETVVLYMWLTT